MGQRKKRKRKQRASKPDNYSAKRRAAQRLTNANGETLRSRIPPKQRDQTPPVCFEGQQGVDKIRQLCSSFDEFKRKSWEKQQAGVTLMVSRKPETESLFECLDGVVRDVMKLYNTAILKFLPGAWIFEYKYTQAGGPFRWWHVDNTNIKASERKWSISVTLESDNSHFELQAGCQYKEGCTTVLKQPIVIFQNHCVHTGVLEKKNSKRTVFACEFGLDDASHKKCIESFSK